MFYLAESLARQRRPKGNRLAIISNAGGPAVIAVDQLLKQGASASTGGSPDDHRPPVLPSSAGHSKTTRDRQGAQLSSTSRSIASRRNRAWCTRSLVVDDDPLVETNERPPCPRRRSAPRHRKGRMCLKRSGHKSAHMAAQGR